MYPIKKIQQNQLAVFVNILVSISDWFRKWKKKVMYVEDSVVLQIWNESRAQRYGVSVIIW